MIVGLDPEDSELGSVKGVSALIVMGEIGDGPIIVAEREDPTGLGTLPGLRACGIRWMGAATRGRFSATLASRRGRYRDPPPRSWDIRLSNWLR